MGYLCYAKVVQRSEVALNTCNPSLIIHSFNSFEPALHIKVNRKLQQSVVFEASWETPEQMGCHGAIVFSRNTQIDSGQQKPEVLLSFCLESKSVLVDLWRQCGLLATGSG